MINNTPILYKTYCFHSANFSASSVFVWWANFYVSQAIEITEVWGIAPTINWGSPHILHLQLSVSGEKKKKKRKWLKVKVATWENSEALWLSVVYERAMKWPRCCGDEISFWWTWRRAACWQHSEAVLNSRTWVRPAAWAILECLTLFLALVLISLLHLQPGRWTGKVRACQLEKGEGGGWESWRVHTATWGFLRT